MKMIIIGFVAIILLILLLIPVDFFHGFKIELNVNYTAPAVVITRIHEDKTCFRVCTSNVTINAKNVLIYFENNDTSNRFNTYTLNDSESSNLIYLYDNNFFSLDDSYFCENSAFTVSTTFTFKNQTREKTVKVNGACQLPEGLSSISSELDRLKERKQQQGSSIFDIMNNTIIGQLVGSLSNIIKSKF